jgi:hypothetical protein
MSRHARSGRGLGPRSLTLEPLEDRLLLSASLGPLPTTAAPNSDAPAASSYQDTPGAPDSDSAWRGTWPEGGTANYSASGGSAHGASMSPSASRAYSSAGQAVDSEKAYAAAAMGREAAGEYDTPSRPAMAQQAAANGTAVVSAAIALVRSAVPVGGPPAFADRGRQPEPLPPLQVPTAAAARPVVPAGGESEPGRAGAKQLALVKALAAALRPPAEAAAGPQAEEGGAVRVPDPEKAPLFPLALPVPGALLPLELPAWEQGVRDFFSHLEALDSAQAEGPAWARLAPWCAALGAATVALEFARRQLSRRPPPGLADVAGRGLAWKWSPGRGAAPE